MTIASEPGRDGPMQPVMTGERPSEMIVLAKASRVPVLGIVGGIGAGKSTVAKAFAALGCHVIDSDARAKAALDRADVRETLLGWWGESILGGDGRVDRGRVASIIFADPAQRSRLEALVHPIVRQEREAMIREARAAGARGVIVDAPLLFEAGVDKECDAVVFVDTPQDVRLARVMASRGWTPQEHARREAAQMSVADKRARCRYVVDNSGDQAQRPGGPGGQGVDAQAAEILDDARRRLGDAVV